MFGQNDMQPQNRRSVSVGDVIKLDNKEYVVKSAGFGEEFFDKPAPIPFLGDKFPRVTKVEQEIGVRISSGTAVRYNPNLTLSELKKMGIRPADDEEIAEYNKQKPLFNEHKIDSIRLASPEKEVEDAERKKMSDVRERIRRAAGRELDPEAQRIEALEAKAYFEDGLSKLEEQELDELMARVQARGKWSMGADMTKHYSVGSRIKAIEDDLKIGVKKGMSGIIVREVDPNSSFHGYVIRTPEGKEQFIHASVARPIGQISD
jgi:rRNA maturation endonuclease Nob1